MKYFVLAFVVLFGCSSKRSPEIAANPPQSKVEPQPTPRKSIFENAGVKRIFIACNSAASFLPSRCPNQTIKVTVRNGPIACHWECGQSTNEHQPQHGPWKLTSAEITNPDLGTLPAERAGTPPLQ